MNAAGESLRSFSCFISTSKKSNCDAAPDLSSVWALRSSFIPPIWHYLSWSEWRKIRADKCVCSIFFRIPVMVSDVTRPLLESLWCRALVSEMGGFPLTCTSHLPFFSPLFVHCGRWKNRVIWILAFLESAGCISTQWPGKGRNILQKKSSYVTG